MPHTMSNTQTEILLVLYTQIHTSLNLLITLLTQRIFLGNISNKSIQ